MISLSQNQALSMILQKLQGAGSYYGFQNMEIDFIFGIY